MYLCIRDVVVVAAIVAGCGRAGDGGVGGAFASNVAAVVGGVTVDGVTLFNVKGRRCR